jgi:hypothetical protein
LINFHDLSVKGSKLFSCFLNKLIFPLITDGLKLILGLDCGALVLVFFLLLQEFVDVGEGSSNDVDEEVVHEVSVVSFELQIRWLSSHRQEDDTSIESRWMGRV